MINEIALAVIPVIVAPIGWLWNRQSRINERVVELDKQTAVTNQGIEDLKVLINTRFDDMDYRLERVERKVLNGSYGER